jgi:predicted phosphodiesterase
MKTDAVATLLGMSRNIVAKTWWNFNKQTQETVTEAYKPVTTPKPMLHFPAPQVVRRPENENSDMGEWVRRRDTLLKQNDFVRVMHMNDVHYPYHDSAALELWHEIASRFQPQIVAVGSDMHDYPLLSNFEPDADISVDDWQEQTREYYWPEINYLNQLLPNAIIVYFYGNHERRALKAIKASDSPKVNMAYFLETIRCNGRVLHIGRTEHIEIGSLIVAHGNKAGKYAADKIGLLWPGKIVNFGHIHKHQAFGNAFSNGMLCQQIPHYDAWGYPNTQEQGTSTMTVDTHGGVAWSHHNFVPGASGLWTQYGNEMLSVTKAANVGGIAA